MPSAFRFAAERTTETLTLQHLERRIGRFRVQVVSGPDAGIERTSDSGEFYIGLAPGNQLILTDRAVSRHHCCIRVNPDGFLLRDLGSRNGTMLGGFRVAAAYLAPGCHIGIGQTSLEFTTLEDPIVEPLAERVHQGRLLGESVAMRHIFALLPRIAASDSTILVEGETGTGKGLLAEMIHEKSPRSGGPFVIIDCGSIPPGLIEAELFGYVKGAFTGAHVSRPGAFESAAGGTVFLDEVGELPLDMQPKLLRALEERVVRRLGSLEPVRLDVRIIAATNRDLRFEVNRGTFRADLFYRLNTVRLRLPSLRERREDIPLLVHHFYQQFAREMDPPLSMDLLASFVKHDWPGNVRELRSAVERAILMGDPSTWFETLHPVSGTVLNNRPDASNFASDLDKHSFRAAKEEAVARWERGYIEALVRKNEGNLSRSARAARMDRNYLRELIRRHGISATEE
ncbi:MAG TPA: sigma 54-interacting transcriptional regulator [Polyangium sp.]|nr:sigma 54-interacting transcriptional regulator [Polyangium sp.]